VSGVRPDSGIGGRSGWPENCQQSTNVSLALKRTMHARPLQGPPPALWRISEQGRMQTFLVRFSYRRRNLVQATARCTEPPKTLCFSFPLSALAFSSLRLSFFLFE
jgi:hypothetical protein